MRSLRMAGVDRKNQIVDTAIQLFSEKGFNGTKTKEIADAVGISEAAIFKYFSTKEELYSAIIDRKTNQSPPFQFPEKEASERNDYLVFLKIAQVILKRHLKDPSYLRLLYFSALEGHELVDMACRTHYLKNCSRLAEYIEMRVREGGFSAINPQIAARTFLGMIVHYIISRLIFKDPSLDSDKSIDPASFLVTLFLNGIRASSRTEI
ncbi:MAG TPA: TetR/AcrR family transcriptional regulator [Acidobacteriota bacterium]